MKEVFRLELGCLSQTNKHVGLFGLLNLVREEVVDSSLLDSLAADLGVQLLLRRFSACILRFFRNQLDLGSASVQLHR